MTVREIFKSFKDRKIPYSIVAQKMNTPLTTYGEIKLKEKDLQYYFIVCKDSLMVKDNDTGYELGFRYNKYNQNNNILERKLSKQMLDHFKENINDFNLVLDNEVGKAYEPKNIISFKKYYKNLYN